MSDSLVHRLDHADVNSVHRCLGSDIFGEAAARIRELEAERDAAIEQRQEQHEIVARIWKMFGSPTYEELAGQTIYDVIGNLQAHRHRLETDLAELRIIHRDLCGSHDTLNAIAARRLDALHAAEARCRKLEEALEKIKEARMPGEARRLAHLALLDQADGEER